MQRFLLVVHTSITPKFPCQRVCQTEVGIKIILLHQLLLSHAGGPHTRATRDAKCKLPPHIQFLTRTHTHARAPALGQAFGQMQIRPGRGGVSDSVLGNPSGGLGQWLITASCLPCPHKQPRCGPTSVYHTKTSKRASLKSQQTLR